MAECLDRGGLVCSQLEQTRKTENIIRKIAFGVFRLIVRVLLGTWLDLCFGIVVVCRHPRTAGRSFKKVKYQSRDERQSFLAAPSFPPRASDHVGEDRDAGALCTFGCHSQFFAGTLK